MVDAGALIKQSAAQDGWSPPEAPRTSDLTSKQAKLNSICSGEHAFVGNINVQSCVLLVSLYITCIRCLFCSTVFRVNLGSSLQSVLQEPRFKHCPKQNLPLQQSNPVQLPEGPTHCWP
jgi:hypothetical protein